MAEAPQRNWNSGALSGRRWELKFLTIRFLTRGTTTHMIESHTAWPPTWMTLTVDRTNGGYDCLWLLTSTATFYFHHWRRCWKPQEGRVLLLSGPACMFPIRYVAGYFKSGCWTRGIFGSFCINERFAVLTLNSNCEEGQSAFLRCQIADFNQACSTEGMG